MEAFSCQDRSDYSYCYKYAKSGFCRTYVSK